MTHGSLFSGIGGFDLAAEWAGWQNLFNCEIDPFCQTVLKHHFPDAEQFTDIRTADFARYKDRLDVLTGGFPCQPFSTAGKRKGTEDDRYLWPEMLGVIRIVRPRWIVGENVYGIVCWSDGLVFKQVCIDLEAEGYEVQPYVLPACGVGAPHQRYRTWFVAKNAECIRCDGQQSEEKSEIGGFRKFSAGNHVRVCDGAKIMENSGSFGCGRQEVLHQQPGRTPIVGAGENRTPGRREKLERDDSHTENERFSERILYERHDTQRRQGQGRFSTEYSCVDRGTLPTALWSNFPTQSPVCSRNDGLSYGLDGIAFSKWRMESIKAYGNAVVPQVVYQIFETINEYEALSRAERSGR